MKPRVEHVIPLHSSTSQDDVESAGSFTGLHKWTSRRYTLHQPEGYDTWEDAVSSVANVDGEHSNLVCGPPELQYVYKRSLFFRESPHVFVRLLRPIGTVVQLLLVLASFISMSLYVDVNFYFTTGVVIATLPSFLVFYIVHWTSHIRADGSGTPGVGLRAFALLGPTEASSVVTKRLTLPYLVHMMYIFGCSVPLLIYFILRFNDFPPWAKVTNTLGYMMTLFLPQIRVNVPNFGGLMYYTMHVAAHMIRSRKVFVNDASTGRIDWPAVQRNFDVLESFVENLQSSWRTYFACVLYVTILSMVTGAIGFGVQLDRFLRSDERQASMCALLVGEAFATTFQVASAVCVWTAGSEVSAACDTGNTVTMM